MFKHLILFFLLTSIIKLITCDENHQNEETPVCGGFIDFEDTISAETKKQIDFSAINIQLYTTNSILKDNTNLAASGYYFLPIYDNESFILKIIGPNGMNFEPAEYKFNIDSERTIKDICQKDINFRFKGYIVDGQISTFGSNNGPEGLSLGLYDSNDAKIQTVKTPGPQGQDLNPGSSPEGACSQQLTFSSYIRGPRVRI